MRRIGIVLLALVLLGLGTAANAMQRRETKRLTEIAKEDSKVQEVEEGGIMSSEVTHKEDGNVISQSATAKPAESGAVLSSTSENPIVAPTEPEKEEPQETQRTDAHEHYWQPHYANRTVVVSAAYDEPIYESRPIYDTQPVYDTVYVCATCGATGGGHVTEDCSGTVIAQQVEVGTQQVQVGTEQVQVGSQHHDAVTSTENYIDYYYCSCGETK